MDQPRACDLWKWTSTDLFTEKSGKKTILQNLIISRFYEFRLGESVIIYEQ